MQFKMFPILGMCLLMVHSARSRESFSHVQDIVKINVTSWTATFDLHCTPGSRCEITLRRTDQLIDSINLTPKWGYQRHTFFNLDANTWYNISKIIYEMDGTGKLIESGRFRTKMMVPVPPTIINLVCLEAGQSVLVRWSSPVPFYPQAHYSYSIIWWQQNQSNRPQMAMVTGQASFSRSIDPYCALLTNLTDSKIYQIKLQAQLMDDGEQLRSEFSPINTFHCGSNSDGDWNWLNLVIAMLTVAALLTSGITLALILLKRRCSILAYDLDVKKFSILARQQQEESKSAE